MAKHARRQASGNPLEAMTPHCAALRDFGSGGLRAPLHFVRSDGRRDEIPVHLFFSGELSACDAMALDLCTGHVLDVGAGAGRHSVLLMSKGLAVTAIDVCSEAVAILRERGITDSRQADVFGFQSDTPYDTVLMLSHGFGIAGSIAGLGRLLSQLRALTTPGSIVLADSLDVARTVNEEHLAYQRSLIEEGRYRGEARFHMEYNGLTGTDFTWLHVDPVTLSSVADEHGWSVDIVWEDEGGDYLARLARVR